MCTNVPTSLLLERIVSPILPLVVQIDDSRMVMTARRTFSNGLVAVSYAVSIIVKKQHTPDSIIPFGLIGCFNLIQTFAVICIIKLFFDHEETDAHSPSKSWL